MIKITKNIVSGDDCLQYVEKPIGFLSSVDWGITSENAFNYFLEGTVFGSNPILTNESIFKIVYQQYSPSGTPTGENRFDLNCGLSRDIIRFNHSGRICGLITNENEDGSFEVAIFGNEHLKTSPTASESNCDFAHFWLEVENMTSISASASETGDILQPEFNTIVSFTSGDTKATLNEIYYGSLSREVTPDNLMDYEPYFINNYDRTFVLFHETGKYNGTLLKNSTASNYNFTLTTNKNTTLSLGLNNVKVYRQNAQDHKCIVSGAFKNYDIRSYMAGDFMKLSQNIWSQALLWNGFNALPFQGSTYYGECDSQLWGDQHVSADVKNHAFSFMPCNMILTRNETQARRYVEDGTLPTDAFLYPLDWENLPSTEGDIDDEPGGDPDAPDDVDDTPNPEPQITPQMATNNNLYWVQGSNLQSFFNWFWTEAGDIATLDDLWQAIQGLYSSLSEAIIRVTFFPAFESYIGGTSTTNSIILGQLVHAQEGVKKINGHSPSLVTLGEYDVKPYYKNFLDYQPYTDIAVYLPFHGFIELDTNIIMGHKLVVKALFDVISGTIQYDIKRDGTTINTVIAKMGVDIPLTLVSKADYDSTIAGNIMSTISGLMNPVKSIGHGLGMITGANTMSKETNSVPMSVRGTQGETGAFYEPNRCAIYIKRPRYDSGYENIKDSTGNTFGKHLGYPCYKQGKLSSKKLSGFFNVANPKINFTKKIPLQDEVNEIYDLLTKGVYK